jgi:hypothetical protein
MRRLITLFFCPSYRCRTDSTFAAGREECRIENGITELASACHIVGLKTARQLTASLSRKAAGRQSAKSRRPASSLPFLEAAVRPRSVAIALERAAQTARRVGCVSTVSEVGMSISSRDGDYAALPPCISRSQFPWAKADLSASSSPHSARNRRASPPGRYW